MYVGDHARLRPDHPALVDAGTGTVLTYAELDARSNQLAHLLRAAGLKPGDVLALYMENNARFLEVAWAALRSGLYLTAVNRYLTAEEAAYIINDSDSVALVSSRAKADAAAALPALCPALRCLLMTDGAIEGWDAYEDATAAFPPTPVPDETAGDFMLYSSGTTGRPKGVRRPLRNEHPSEDTLLTTVLAEYNFDAQTIYL